MQNLALGIDIGGTKIYYALINNKGEIIDEVQKSLTPKTTKEIKELLKEIINKYNGKVKIAGIATAGAVSNNNDKVISSTGNLPQDYRTIDFKKLSDNINIYIENDANCAAWAEHISGAAKEYQNSITLTLGTGVGGGIIINNELLKGKNGAAGEMHFKMSTDAKRQCTCGAQDCFEIYASGLGLKLTYKDITGVEISTYEIIEKANSGDIDAIAALKRWNEYIAMGALGLNNIFDTEIIVLSGSMAEFSTPKTIEEYINKYTVTTPTKVKKAQMGNFAGLIGAALIAFKLAEK